MRQYHRIYVGSISEDECENTLNGEPKKIETCQEAWVWESVNNEPYIVDFLEKGGPNDTYWDSTRESTNLNPFDVLSEFLPLEFWQKVAVETNRYASQMLVLKKKTGEFSDAERNWFDVTVDELKAHFSLAIIM